MSMEEVENEVYLGLKKKLDQFKKAIQSPRLYLADYFDTIKNKIDIEAEKVLEKSFQSSTKTDEQKYANQNVINSNRKQMLDEVNKLEAKCFDNLTNEQLETVEKLLNDVECYEKMIEDLENKQANLDPDIFDDECLNLYQLINASFYALEKKIRLSSSLIFLNVSEFQKYFLQCNMLVNDNQVEFVDEDENGKIEYVRSENEEEEKIENKKKVYNFNNRLAINRATAFGFLYLLNDCILKADLK